ncbi:MAG: bifunctional demethylmenaquinone methyltransferase/2-methoxy-6-polyprenyl-1,4-benzoquinol methylase UbiE [Phycisphaerales bacterium]|jgi:demethylmenaquinone methyltransferase/2-methoxy-6-polyprenyl-1,4-benzoquinol methylase|nr:bifunctional demethylmenaquinone methyltransferase/2-methoxy-6-polyprenyl-1,4-benzoquinol methylase UbiE [Phycisphaerales bacterium]
MVSSDPTSTAWDESSLRDPHHAADKRGRVQRMFSAIAPSYDLNNRLHSLGMDQWWRKKAVKLAGLKAGERVVDVACGTGDLTLQFERGLKKLGEDSGPAKVLGVDFTYAMLPIAVRKAAGRGSPARYINGDAQGLPLADGCCDVVSIAFGIRNVQEPERAMREFVRILRPGGRVIVLEFSLPENPVLRGMYNLYFRKILPISATWISGDRSGAYKYLPESVNTFIGRDRMMQIMREAGLSEVRQVAMTFGVCVCYVGMKK